jgi:hypothetical protein
MSSILQTFQLGTQWPTLDPFLFCAHHLDDYPNGTVDLQPDASLNSRNIGQDFDGIDGWNMYHGKNVPGFPQHPHRGFETITYVRTGVCDHSDSMGATARFGRGDTQWMTAGQGIVHCEMFPMLNRDEKNPLEMFQIWLNLPAVDKMVDPYFTMLWSHDTPTVVEAGPDGQLVDVTVIAGSLASRDGADAVTAQAPPPNSWAARAEADLAIWHLRFDAGASLTMPAGRRHQPDPVRIHWFGDHDQRRDDRSRHRRSGRRIHGARTGCRFWRCRHLRNRDHGATGPPNRRAGSAIRPLRHEYRRRNSPGVLRLQAHRVRWLAMAE